MLILDWMMPEPSGLEICRQIRQNKLTKNIPVIFLTAKGDEDNKITGLEAGADDYMVKPFSPRELVARVKAIQRRVRLLRSHSETTPMILKQGELQLDKPKRKATKEGSEISFTPSEFELLAAMMSAPGRVFSRQDLLDQIHPHNNDVDVVDRAIDVHIGNIRRKIESDPTHPHYIHTVRGIGYRFSEHI